MVIYQKEEEKGTLVMISESDSTGNHIIIALVRGPTSKIMSDPKEILEEKCAQTEKCRPLLEAYQRCASRVEARGEANTETCVEELFELQPCIDSCVRTLHLCTIDVICYTLILYLGVKTFIQKIKIKTPLLHHILLLNGRSSAVNKTECAHPALSPNNSLNLSPISL